MVAGKTNPSALARSATASATRLPPLPALRVRRPDVAVQNPCTAVMSTMLGCWASHGQSAAGCAALEQQLRTCMDSQRTLNQTKSTINRTLSRFSKQIMTPTKKGK